MKERRFNLCSLCLRVYGRLDFTDKRTFPMFLRDTDVSKFIAFSVVLFAF